MSKNNGFTLIEFISSIILMMTFFLLLSQFTFNFLNTARNTSASINIIENSQVLERIIMKELKNNIEIDSVYEKNKGWLDYDDFQSGDILVLYYKTKKYNEDGFRYNALNFKKNTSKLLIREDLINKIENINSIGGYDIATGIKNVYIEKHDTSIKFIIKLMDNEIIYEKIILIEK